MQKVSPTCQPVSIRPMAVDDLPGVVDLEARAFPQPWSRKFFEAELARQHPPGWVWVATAARGGLAGYLVAWLMVDEVHLGNLAVEEGCRRQGVAATLLGCLERAALERRAAAITLEVRTTNRAALCLYARHRFRPIGVRRGYYGVGRDAVVMLREL